MSTTRTPVSTRTIGVEIPADAMFSNGPEYGAAAARLTRNIFYSVFIAAIYARAHECIILYYYKHGAGIYLVITRRTDVSVIRHTRVQAYEFVAFLRFKLAGKQSWRRNINVTCLKIHVFIIWFLWLITGCDGKNVLHVEFLVFSVQWCVLKCLVGKHN